MHFRKASDKVNLVDLTTPFKKIKDNNALLETVNELLDARAPFPRLEAIKGTSKDEFLTWLAAGGTALAGGVSKLFVNKIPMGYDRFIELFTIWATITGIATALRTVPRAIISSRDKGLVAFLKKDLQIEVYKLDQNNNQVAGSFQTIKIGTLEQFLDEKDNLIYRALKSNGITNDYYKQFDDPSATVLMDAYEKIRKINLTSLTGSVAVGGLIVAPIGASTTSALSRGEPVDWWLSSSPESKAALPPRTILDPRNPPITKEDIRGQRFLK